MLSVIFTLHCHPTLCPWNDVRQSVSCWAWQGRGASSPDRIRVRSRVP